MSGLVISEQVENIRFNWLSLTNESGKKALSGENCGPNVSEERVGLSVTIVITDRVTSVPIAQHSKILGLGLRSGRHRPEQLYSN